MDGVPGNEATDIEIAANDSLYIFGEVTINPDDPLSLSPYIVEDKLKLSTSLKCHFKKFNALNLVLSFIRIPFATFKTLPHAQNRRKNIYILT